jgi:hypothetical protein
MNERPRCQCHNLTMTIRNDRPRNPWRCTVAHVEAQNRYLYSDKGQATTSRYEATTARLVAKSIPRNRPTPQTVFVFPSTRGRS